MSLDPNQLYQSSGLKKVQDGAKRGIKNYARRSLGRYLLRKKSKWFTKGAAKTAAKLFIKAAYKVLVKGFLWLLGGLLSLNALAIFGLLLGIIIIVVAFTTFNFALSSDFDIDEINLPSNVTTYTVSQEIGKTFPIDNLAFLLNVNVDTILYNQVVKIPDQRKLKSDLELKKKRHSSMPDPANDLSVADINDMFIDLFHIGHNAGTKM